MNTLSKIAVVLFLSVFLFSSAASGKEGNSLFVSLTSDEINRAAMAIKLGTRVRNEKQIPVTIFLNVEGVRIADKNIPSPMHVSGKTLRDMLLDFMNAGGKVIVCPMCMKNVGGLSSSEIVEGAVIGSSQVTMPALFAEGATVLSY